MPSNPRVTKAFRAMRDLGVSEEKVKPVLKNLLKLYDKNWELIEEENYRVLADAIFDSEEAEASNSTKKIENTKQKRVLEEEALQHDEEAERPLKRLRLKYQGQVSGSSNNATHLASNSLIMPKDEPIELPELQPQNKAPSMAGALQSNNGNLRNESCQPLNRNKGKQPILPKSLTIPERESVAVPHQMSPGKRGKEALLPQFASREKKTESEKLSHASPAKNAAGVLLLVQPKEEPYTGDFPECLPLAVIHPGMSNKEDFSGQKSPFREKNVAEPLASESLGEKTTTDGFCALPSGTVTNSELATIADESASQLQVATSPLGEVQISLSCNRSKLGSDFNTPSLGDVVKVVQDKCLRSYKILDPNFSVMKVMKDMCQSFLELGTESCHESRETQLSRRTDLMRKISSGETSVGGDMNFDNLKGLNVAQSDTVMVLPEVLQLPACSEIMSDSTEPDKVVGHCNGEVHVGNEQNDLDDATCENLVMFQQSQSTSGQIPAPNDVIDISKGQEKVPISLVNGKNDERPPSFHYIPQNAVFQNAYLNFSLARIGDDNCCSTCAGDCLSSPTPCVCAHETGGEFAYTAEGLVKESFLNESVSMNRDSKKHCQYFCKECPLERSKNDDMLEPCKGHLVRKFIKECWWKCGCSKKCGNRVVQRGITRNLQVFMTEGKGWGLRTLEDLPKGAFVCEYVGEVLTNAELFDRISRISKGEGHSYPVLLDADWGCEGVLKDEEALCLDATFYGNVARFINHRCYDSNMVEIPVEVETPDHHYYHLAFFTTRKVKAMEELTWDYGIDFDDVEHPVQAFRCQCGSRFCRNIKRLSRSRSSARR